MHFLWMHFTPTDWHIPSSRTLQIANASTNNGHKARITLEGTNGYVGIWTSTPSHALEVNGQFKATEEAIFGTTSTDLGNGQTSTLTPASSVHLLDATSITMNAAVGAHVMTHSGRHNRRANTKNYIKHYH
jgi:hypothetical protein